MQMVNFKFRFQINPIVLLRPQLVLHFLTVQAHHNDGRLNNGKTDPLLIGKNGTDKLNSDAR